jgi:lipopolysaccharide export system protein LptC
MAAEQQPPAATIDAKNLRVERDKQMAYGEGDVVLKHKDMTLRADKARYNIATDEIWAEGNVRLNRANQEWVAPAAYYNMKTRAFKTESARGVFDSLVIRGENINMTASNRYGLSKATLTTCEYDQPHYRLEATRAEVSPGERIVLYNVTVRLGNVPVFWFPVVAWALNERGSPIGVTLGQDSRHGFFILTHTRVSLDRHVQATFRVDERTKRGPAAGADFDYYYSNARGTVKGYYARDTAAPDQLDTLLGKRIPHNRYRGDWQHKQELPGDMDITVNASKQSDVDFMDDFFRSQYQREGEPASVADVTKRGENYTLSVMAQPQLNPFFAEVERLPEAKWSLNRMRIFNTPVFYEAETSAGYYHNVPGLTNQPPFVGGSPRADTFHQLVVPQQHFGWLSVIPRAGIRGTWYKNGQEGFSPSNEVRRLFYTAGVESSFKLWRTWDDVEDKRWDIHGLRHVAEPFVDYQWVASPNKHPRELPPFDTYRFATLLDGRRMLVTRYHALEMPADTAIDAFDRMNLARFGARQKLQTRRNGQPWDLATLEAWTEYSFEETLMNRDFSDLFTTLRFDPFQWCSFGVGSRFDTRDGQWRELNTDAYLLNHDRWALNITSRYLDGDSNLAGGSVSYRISRHWRAAINQLMDFQDGTWLSQEYVLQQETHDWIFNYGFRRTGQRVREDENLFFFSLSLKAYPSTQIGIR